MSKFVECINHVSVWCASGEVFKDMGFTIPVGVVAFVETAKFTFANEVAQSATIWLGALSILVTLFIKIWNFVRDNRK